MSNYMGRFIDSPIIDFLLESVFDRGNYDEEQFGEAVSTWDENDGERRFWENQLGPAIDHLEGVLGRFGLQVTPKCDICNEPELCPDGRDDCQFQPGDWNGETGNHLSCEANDDLGREFLMNKEVWP
jgi:hypothetical protein